MEPKRDRMIHPKAEAYLEADEACKLAKTERDGCRETLSAAMKKRGLTVYAYDNVRVELNESTKVKAKRIEVAPDEGDEPEPE